MIVAVLIPCFNEEATIGKVVHEFKAELPDAAVFVYDNNSTDSTSQVAAAAGAVVRREPLRGKGNVVRRMFADVDAQLYVLVDGDATYSAPSVREMIDLLVSNDLDMVTGNRLSEEALAYRSGHRFGNKVLTGIVSAVFGRKIGDMLSGYRVLSRRFVKSFPAMARGFETETELTVHALELRLPTAEVDTIYYSRPEGSTSKLSTYRDGVRIIRMIGHLVKEERPFAFFGMVAAVFMGLALALGSSVIIEFAHTGLVPRLPSAVLATGLALLATVSFATGTILASVSLSRREARRFAYLSASTTPTLQPNLDRSEMAA